MLKIHLCAMVEAAVVRPSHALKLFGNVSSVGGGLVCAFPRSHVKKKKA